MAPWWLRSKKEDPADDEDEFADFADDGVLDLLGTESDEEGDEEEGAEEEAFTIGWEPEAPRSPSDDEEREPKPEVERRAASEAGDAPAEKRKRKRKRRRKKSAEDEPAERAPSPASRAVPEPPPERAAEKPKPMPRLEPLTKDEIVFDLPERSPTTSDERKIALFCDLENIALGVRNSEIKKFDINLVLERLLEKGKIIVKRAYADWERYSELKRAFHEAAIELIDIPQKRYSGKNSADIKMVVDAMDLCFSKEHLDTFVLLSGDSDFSPLVSKLKENNKFVIGMGVKNSTSALLIDNCDEFIYYEDVWRDLQLAPRLDHLSEKDAEVFGLLIDSILALVRENKSILWGSMIKQTMQRKRPSFSEGYYSYSSFSNLLEDAQTKSIIRLKRDPRSGNYAVTGFGE